MADCVASAILSVEEFPAQFASKRLEDLTVEEGCRAYFTVELSQRGGIVQWFVDGKQATDDKKYQAVAVGTSRTLTVLDCERGVDENVRNRAICLKLKILAEFVGSRENIEVTLKVEGK